MQLLILLKESQRNHTTCRKMLNEIQQKQKSEHKKDQFR